jgi:hypothetical protein
VRARCVAIRLWASRQLKLVVVHPLWRADHTLLSRLGVAALEVRTLPIDTFDLERRPLRALEMVEERGPVPAFQANGDD